MTDSSKVVRARYDYDPYGKRGANQITSNPIEADFGFTGHFFHAASGLYVALFRAFDPEFGRWLSRDPLGEEVELNLYGFVYNDPVNWFDPDGRAPARQGPPRQSPNTPRVGGRGGRGVRLSPEETVYENASRAARENQLRLRYPGHRSGDTYLTAPCPPRLAPQPNAGQGPRHGSRRHDQMIEDYIQSLPPEAFNIRKNQVQTDINGFRRGDNRPDVQLDLRGLHYNVEFDHNFQNSIRHFKTINRNDPNSVIQLVY